MISSKNRFPLYVIPLVLWAGMALAEDAGQKTANPVVARIHNETIHLDEVKVFYEKTKGNFGNASFDQAYPAVLDEIIAQKALVADAKKSKLDRDPEVIKQIEAATETILWSHDLAKKVTPLITDAAISELYLTLVKAYEGKEEAHARHILVASEDDAVKLIKKLKKGGDFAALAKESSTDKGSAANGGDLGFFTEGTMVPEFSAAAFALQPGAITEKPVKTQFGWHIIKLEEKRKATPPSLESVKAQIQKQLTQQKTKDVIAMIEAEMDIKKFNQDGSPLEAKK